MTSGCASISLHILFLLKFFQFLCRVCCCTSTLPREHHSLSPHDLCPHVNHEPIHLQHCVFNVVEYANLKYSRIALTIINIFFVRSYQFPLAMRLCIRMMTINNEMTSSLHHHLIIRPLANIARTISGDVFSFTITQAMPPFSCADGRIVVSTRKNSRTLYHYKFLGQDIPLSHVHDTNKVNKLIVK